MRIRKPVIPAAFGLIGATVAAVAVIGSMAAIAPAMARPTLTQPATARSVAPNIANVALAPISTPASAPQPGQTGWRAALGDLPTRTAPKITEALQPGQTVSAVGPGEVSISADRRTPVTGTFAPTSAPQPGQTGW